MIDTSNWERTARGKLICPDCGATGWSGGAWLDKHAEHVDCDICGKRVSRRGYRGHLRAH